MKRTTLNSMVMASLMVSTIAAPTFAGGRGGGSGGHSFGGGNSGGHSFGGNFAAKSSSNFNSQAQVFRGSVNNNVNHVNKINSQPFTQKFQPTVHNSVNHAVNNQSLGIANKHLNGINNQQFHNGNQMGKFKSGNSNWWCSTPSKNCGNWYPGKYCGYFGCYPYYGCYPYSGCYSNWCYPSCSYYSSCNYYPTCYDYSYSNCSYGPQYCSPLYVSPVSYGTSGVTATASSPVVVNVDARDADQPAAVPGVAKTVAADRLIEMKLGGTYALPGSGYGTKAGQMFMEVGDVALGVKVDDWDDQKVSFTLPMIGLAKATDAKLHLVSSEGQPIKSTPVRLVMPTQMTAQQ